MCPVPSAWRPSGRFLAILREAWKGLVRNLNLSWSKALPQAIHRPSQNSFGHLLGQAFQGGDLTQVEVNPSSGPTLGPLVNWFPGQNLC